jgi:hypothetical protein
MLPDLQIQLTREYLLKQREALLLQVDAIERVLDMPRTSDLRKAEREKQKIESVVNLPQSNK